MKYRIDSIKIGIIKPEKDIIENIYDDFLFINKNPYLNSGDTFVDKNWLKVIERGIDN